jgi:hypothetical protein
MIVVRLSPSPAILPLLSSFPLTQISPTLEEERDTDGIQNKQQTTQWLRVLVVLLASLELERVWRIVAGGRFRLGRKKALQVQGMEAGVES